VTSTPEAADPRSRTKWLDDIPYDVFYDQPLAVAAENAAVLTADSSPAPGAATADPSPSDLESPAARGTTGAADSPAQPIDSAAVDWQRLAAMDVLHEEVKLLRNQLSTNLQTLASYNRHVEAVALDAVTLSALAGVMSLHPEPLVWKPHALHVRDLAADIAQHATETGREPYSAAQKAFEELLVVLDGGPPPDRPVDTERPFADYAARGDLMLRVKRSFDGLKAETSTDAGFKQAAEDAVREASVLATLGGIVTTESYDLVEEPKYVQFAREFVDANVDIAQAASAGQFADFQSAFSRLQNSCASCHGEYAFGDEGL
jgi:hypothetical protein